MVTSDGKLALRTTPELLKAYIKSSGYYDKNNGFSEFVKSLKTGKEQVIIMIPE